MSAFPTDRFVLPALATVAAAGLTLVPLPSSALSPASGERAVESLMAQQPVRLSDSDGGVRAVSLPLSGDSLARRLPTETFTMVAVTWRDPDVQPGDIAVQVERDGRWQEPIELHRLQDGPDAGERHRDTLRMRAPRDGTDLVWVGASEGVRVQVEPHDSKATGSKLPHGLRLELLDARPLASDNPMAQWERPADDELAPKPDIYSRKDWGADPDWRDGTLRINKTIRQVHVHHTVNGNDYSRADVPAILRGIYRYHTQTLKWADIGYNFLVDRFGRTWMGRAGGKGGAGKPVQGAHTLGFNKNSTGVAVIGNYEEKRAPDRVISAIVNLAAWKLDKYGRDPDGKIRVTSTGSDLYPEGERVRLPVIDGHRDTNETACPGARLYKRLPEIRDLTRKRVDSFG